MLSNTPSTRRIVRADKPFVSGPRHRADFARQATIAEFGPRYARALDQADFVDRAPGLVRLGKIAGHVIERLAGVREVRDAS